MSVMTRPLNQIFTPTAKGIASRAIRFGTRAALDTMTLGSLGRGAAIGVGATVARNIMQGRDTFDGTLRGAFLGGVGMYAYRSGIHAKQFAKRMASVNELRRAAKLAGTTGYRSSSIYRQAVSDMRRIRRPFFETSRV